MAKHKLGVALCAAVVGSLIGTGAAMYAEDVALSATVGEEVSYINVGTNFRKVAQKRAVRRSAHGRLLDVGTHGSATIAPSGDVDARDPLTFDCELKVMVAEDLAPKVLGVIPVNSDTQVARHEVSRIFDEYVAGCDEMMQEPEVEEDVMEDLPVIVPRVNNNCDQYGLGTVRYTHCVVNERNGDRYLPSQWRGANFGE